MNIYRWYVYAYIRDTDMPCGKAGTPYYIGQGSNRRAWEIYHGSVSRPSNPRNIIIIESCLSQVGAFALERRLIKRWGKLVDNTGILYNVQDGGPGMPPNPNPPHCYNVYDKNNTLIYSNITIQDACNILGTKIAIFYERMRRCRNNNIPLTHKGFTFVRVLQD